MDYVPGRAPVAAAVPVPVPLPDVALPLAVFPWLAARLTARRRENLPITEASLRADLALGFAAQMGEAGVWPEAAYTTEGGPRLGMLVKRETGNSIAVECRYPHRSSPGQPALSPRQLGDLLRDAMRLHRNFATGPRLQVLLCTDEFRVYLTSLRPLPRLLRADSVGEQLQTEFNLNELEDSTRNRLTAELAGQPAEQLRLGVYHLGYAPVGPLHLAMWHVLHAESSA